MLQAVALAVHGASENITIHSAHDAKKVIKEKTNLTYDIIVHYNDKTEEINRSIGNLSSLTGALAIHEVLIGSDLKKKHLTTNPFYKSVQIKESMGESHLLSLYYWIVM